MTTETHELPPMPIPTDHRYAVIDWKGRVVYQDHVPPGQTPQETQEMFTADDMREYARTGCTGRAGKVRQTVRWHGRRD